MLAKHGKASDERKRWQAMASHPFGEASSRHSLGSEICSLFLSIQGGMSTQNSAVSSEVLNVVPQNVSLDPNILRPGLYSMRTFG